MRLGRQSLGIVALCAWLSCTTEPVPSDAGGLDTGVDGRSGDVDATDAESIDAAPSDAVPHDAPPRDTDRPDVHFDDAGPPEWESIRGSLPSSCTLDRAVHPERMSELRVHLWACAARDACLESAPLPGLSPAWLAVDGANALGTAEAADGTVWLFVTPLDGGAPIAVFRGGRDDSTPRCALVLGTLGGGRVGFAVDFDDGLGAIGTAFYVADVAGAASIDPPILDDRTHFTGGAFAQALYASSTALVAWISSGYFAELTTGAPVAVYDTDGPTALEGSASVVDDTILVLMETAAPYIAIGTAGILGGRAYHHASAGHEVHEPHTDGTDVAWLETLSGTTDGPFELWAANFVTDPSALAPRRVGTVSSWTRPALGGGLWVDLATDGTATGPLHYEITDLADARMRRYDMPDTIRSAGRTLSVAADRVVYPYATSTGERLVVFDPRDLVYQR